MEAVRGLRAAGSSDDGGADVDGARCTEAVRLVLRPRSCWTAVVVETFGFGEPKKEESMKTLNVQRLATAVTIITAVLALSSSTHAEGEAKTDVPRYAGVLTFAPDGTLFVGDNISSAVFAYKIGRAHV